mmetsp:Transcript_2206/g.3222  ORF Transcript_2206/g.3222 Transcript_2206/m.3222 type:complete len:641 (-) Transcript_2206:101-2023(-)
MPPAEQLVSDAPLNQRGLGVGIDLGTTNSAIAILQNGVQTIPPIPNNGRTMPSVVSLLGEQILTGKDAINAEVHNPQGSYRNVKRVIGMGGTTAAISAEVVPNLVVRTASVRRKGKSMGKHKSSTTQQPKLSQQLKEAVENPARLALPKGEGEGEERETIAPEEISAHILRTLFQTAETHINTGEKVTRAVIGVPAYFNDAQRDATLRACALAGVPKSRLIAEPEAAANAYGIGREQLNLDDDGGGGGRSSSSSEYYEKDELIMVFDLGGGTFDVSILEVGGGVMEVVSTSGNNMLGGSDFDARIADFCSKKMMAFGTKRNYLKNGGDVADAMIRSAEAIRIYLSNNKVVDLAIPLSEEGWLSVEKAGDVIGFPDDVLAGEEGVSNSTHVMCKLSRKAMEELCRDELQALLRPVREVAIFADALLPGDSRPSVVEAAFEMEEDFERAMMEQGEGGMFAYDDFYSEEEGGETKEEEEEIDPNMLLQLKQIDLKAQKKAQQRGRKKAREIASKERTFRNEKRKVDNEAQRSAKITDGKIKVRDGISGRPISQVVLVGGATRMPVIGRLLAALTGIVPQKTVNPDEAVALGCAVQVGILDGDELMGGLKVLSPMQAAVMRALAKKRNMEFNDEYGDDDLDEFY